MDIHIVQPGETIDSIATHYGVSASRLARDNGIRDNNRLVIGDALVIAPTEETYIVQAGDSLLSIADSHGVTTDELLRNNPYISDRDYLTPGEEIVIHYVTERNSRISVNGFTFPHIDRSILRKSLPFLTYLTVSTYRITSDGGLMDINDEEIIQIAKSFNVAPMMFISTLTEEGLLDIDLTHRILNNEQLLNRLTDNILRTLRNKGYYGLNIDTQYILPEDRQLYVEFVRTITERFNREGFVVFVTILPTTFEVATGITYEGIDYVGLGQAANGILYMLSYEWGYPFGLPKSVLSYDVVMRSVSNALAMLPSENCSLGITSIGYIWRLPYVASLSAANFISHSNVLELAYEVGAVIQHDEITRSSFFRFIESGYEYIVWFKDPRIIQATSYRIKEFQLVGMGIWNIMYFFSKEWLVININFEINKIPFT